MDCQVVSDLIALPRPVMEAAALKGLLRPFDDLTEIQSATDWYPYARELSRLQNSTFGLPFAGDALLYMYNSNSEQAAPFTWGATTVISGTLAFPASDPQAVFPLSLYLAAGGAIQAAEIGMKEPCFGLIRPPGHHASANSCWGFCYFNNMAIALEKMKADGKIKKALVLDIDLHFGDGTVNILGSKGYVTLVNPSSNSPVDFIRQVEKALAADTYDVIGISAGFDYAREDWGGVLGESDYTDIGRMVRETARKTGAGFFGILEGGYNHRVLGHNCMALLDGMRED